MNKLEKILELSKEKRFESLERECDYILQNNLACELCSFCHVMVCNCGSFDKCAEQLLEEYEEPRKLTKRERAFCEYAQSGYIEILKGINRSIWHYNKDKLFRTLIVDEELFSFIKCDEQYSVEELLKWEVED